MSNLFWNTISDDMQEVLIGFMQSELANSFYLAGGTALSLQIGHRFSVDLDFFSPSEDIPSIRSRLENAFTPLQVELTDSAWGNLVFLAKNVRVGFYGYGFSLIAPILETEGLRLASVEDIGLMKLDTMLSRASRKDFYNLYFICQNKPLKLLFEKAIRKYPSIRDFESQVTKRLVFFENAEKESQPNLIKRISWENVKKYFLRQAKEIEQSWLT